MSETVPGKSRKDRLINVRVSHQEYAAIEDAARLAGMSVSAFFRSLLLEGAGVRPVLTKEDRLIMAALLEDMRMIGINLNQVARSLNAGRHVHVSELDINLGNVQRIQAAVMSELRTLSRRAGHERRARHERHGMV
ncbi:plasmid mobilization relaxosome protein MobC [Rhizobium sp. FKY42]|uniref:plasmid mobilization protein n=1 Tax=Rhizobium sp. FKY42 TaxID=2562310 RepID=UPI0010C00079|nr:plasmid mobilization relaxosome protein MobC [Rhizobium sp. FKY42]